MNLKPAPEAAVLVSTPLPWILGGASDGLISLGLGLTGVMLARTIFVNRENRALGRRQPIRETLPVTLAACLIAGGIIWDGHLLFSKAIFTGIAVGWTTIVAIEKISRIVNPAEAARSVHVPSTLPLLDDEKARPLPPSNPEHDALLRRLDQQD